MRDKVPSAAVPGALPRAVLFDMDGLMLRSEELWSEVDREVASAYGRTYDPALKPLFMGCEKIESARRFCRAYGLRESADVIAGKRLTLAYAHYRTRVRLMPGLRRLVRDLAAWGKPLAVATSADRVIVSIVRERFEVFSSFQAVVCADDVPRGKPAPDLFLEAARRLRVPASGCVVLEDAPHGVTAALAAGMKVIGVCNPAVEREQMRRAHLLVDRLADLTPPGIASLFRDA